MNAAIKNVINKSLGFIVCGFAGLFLIYEFILQVSPSVMTQGLMESFSINALTLSSAMAMYYYSYAPMQLFSGLSFDYYGARKTLTIATLACAIGTLLIASASSIELAGLGRFLTGAGSSCAFIGVLFLGERWFHPKYFYLVAGITELLGCLGAISGQTVIALAVHTFDWRPTLYALGAFGFILLIAIWLVVREKEAPEEHHCLPEQLSLKQSLRFVLHNKQAWAIALYALFVFAPITIFAALWGVPFLVKLYGISTPLAGVACAMIWLGMGIGSPIVGWFSEKTFSRKKPLAFCSALGIVISIIILYVPHISLSVMFGLLFTFGACVSGQALSFNLVNDNMPSKVIGTAMGFNNLFVVVSGAIFQPVTGFILSHVWHGEMQDGAPLYSLANYQTAFILIPIFFLISFLINHFAIKETHCNNKSFA